jgi:glutamate synthase (NADPH/NADH) small chain
MTLTNQTKTENQTFNFPKATVLSDRCAGCEECLIRCPTQAIEMDNFSWTVVVNEELCVGCLQCVRTCPFAAIEIESDNLSKKRVELSFYHPKNLLFDKSETRRGITNWKDALEEASRCIGCPDPTCVRGCPTHNDIPGFIAALREGNLNKAQEILAKTTVLPDVCSRVCDQALQCGLLLAMNLLQLEH